MNKINQCAFSVNHGTTVCEAATWILTAWDDLYYTNEIFGNVCNYKVKVHTYKFYDVGSNKSCI